MNGKLPIEIFLTRNFPTMKIDAITDGIEIDYLWNSSKIKFLTLKLIYKFFREPEDFA